MEEVDTGSRLNKTRRGVGRPRFFYHVVEQALWMLPLPSGFSEGLNTIFDNARFCDPAPDRRGLALLFLAGAAGDGFRRLVA